MNNEKAMEIKRSGCNKCTDLVAVRKQIVVCRGNPHADTVIVGQNPGAKEDEYGLPFSGPAGKLLDDLIRACGLDPEHDFFFTNVVMCHTDQNAQPTPQHISNCSSNFQAMTSGFKKFLAIGRIAAVGTCTSYYPEKATSLSMTLPMKDIVTRGVPITMRNNRLLFVTYHTSHLLRMGLQITSIDNPFIQTVKNEIALAKRYTPASSKNLKVNVAEGSIF